MYQCSINTCTRKNNCWFSHCNQLHHQNFILKNDLSSRIIFTFMKYKSSCKLILIPGLLIFRGKKAKFRGIFRGKFAEKSADFAGFSREKSQNSLKNQPSSSDFRGRKVKIRRKIGQFRGILVGKKSKFAQKSAQFE